MKTNRSIRPVAAAILAAGLASAPAIAGSDNETFVFRVDASALETPADVRNAYRRLVSEASRYCRALDLTADRDLAACRIDVVANVVEAVGDERLLVMHRNARAERRLASAG